MGFLQRVSFFYHSAVTSIVVRVLFRRKVCCKVDAFDRSHVVDDVGVFHASMRVKDVFAQSADNVRKLTGTRKDQRRDTHMKRGVANGRRVFQPRISAIVG